MLLLGPPWNEEGFCRNLLIKNRIPSETEILLCKGDLCKPGPSNASGCFTNLFIRKSRPTDAWLYPSFAIALFCMAKKQAIGTLQVILYDKWQVNTLSIPVSLPQVSLYY